MAGKCLCEVRGKKKQKGQFKGKNVINGSKNTKQKENLLEKQSAALHILKKKGEESLFAFVVWRCLAAELCRSAAMHVVC